MKRESRWQSWLTSAIMSHDVPTKRNIVSCVASTGLRCTMEAMSAIMTHVGNHDSRQSTHVPYQFLRWKLSCNISWVRRNLLFKLGFLVPFRMEGFSCYNPTETRVREITRHRAKQIILSIIHSLLVTLAVAWERRKFPPLSNLGHPNLSSQIWKSGTPN